MSSSGFVIAATSSGCGKTTFSLGLMRALRERWLDVRPFKCGPDYIDTQFHRVATGRDSINLDAFMASEDYVARTFCRYSEGGDVSIVEGAMGMYDGYDRMKGSSADISRMLRLPVILLVDGASAAYSVAATITGFKFFDFGSEICGVVFNRVASPRHFNLLKEACEDAGMECLGYISRLDALKTPSRHLGLTLSGRQEMENFVQAAAAAVKEHVDINGILELTARKPEIIADENIITVEKRLRIAVARDEAFNFIYPENIRSFLPHEIIYFSPLRDRSLPDYVDMVYLPGGYPELFAKELEANVSMRASVADYVEQGGRMWAECGGMIYLTRDIDGVRMCGVIPTSTTMRDARLSLGYRRVKIGIYNFKGHEFHYSRLTDPDVLPSVGSQFNVRGEKVNTPVYHYKNMYAGYTHLYWGEYGILKLWNL